MIKFIHKAERWRKTNESQTTGIPREALAKMVDLLDNEDTPVYEFPVDNKKQEKIATVGGSKLNVVMDSGASNNIIDKQAWTPQRFSEY